MMFTMTPKLTALTMSAILAGTLLSGCVISEGTYVEDRRPRGPVVVREPGRYEPAPVVYQQQQPGYVIEEPAPPTQVIIVQGAPPAPLLIVRRQPPAVIQERIPARPGPTYVWAGGYWAAQKDKWVW